MRFKITLFLIAVFLFLILLISILNGNLYMETQGIKGAIPHNILVVAISVLIIAGLIVNGILTRLLLQYVEKETELKTQTAYVDSVYELYTNFKSQRHDFNNHVQVLYGMISSGMIDSAKEYIADIFKQTTDLNEIISIDRPEIAALLSAKQGTASANNIKFNIDISCKLNELPVKSYELVKVLGNVIDNAFQEVIKDSQNKVDLNIYKQGDSVKMEIINPGTVKDENKLFEPGVSKKQDHSGMGLYITKNIVEKYKGTINLYSQEGQVKFVITLPLQ